MGTIYLRPLTKLDVVWLWAKGFKWKRVAAILITRIAECWDSTDPGPYVLLGVAFMVSLMTNVMTLHGEPTLSQAIFGTLFRWVWLAVLMEAIVYGLWEMIQMFKWLYEWAKRNRIRYET